MKKQWFGICVFLVLLVAFVLRFTNYENRWGLAYDQARDVIVAKEAIDSYKLPLVGPFSSAGAFVYGPEWFWMLMVMIGIFPDLLITPWIILTILYVGVVWLVILIGRDMESVSFGLLAGLFAAVSTGQVDQATNLISPSMVGVVSTVALYFFVRFLKTGEKKYIFLLSLSVGVAINVHFQAIGLLILLPISFIFGKRSLKGTFLYILGLAISFLPLIIFDLTNNFYESRNILDYYLYGQHRIYVPNRWLTYVGEFWPHLWSFIIGGERWVSFIIFALLPLVGFYVILKRKMRKAVFAFFLSLIAMITILRYYRGIRFENYFVFLHVFVIIATAWVCYRLFLINKVIGTIVAIIILIGSTRLDIERIQTADSFTPRLIHIWKEKLFEKYPKKQFAIYDFQYTRGDKTLPLVLFLDEDKKINDLGIKVGVTIATSGSHFIYPVIIGERGEYQLFDLSSSTSAQLGKEGWAFVNPSAIYQSIVEWYKGKKL